MMAFFLLMWLISMTTKEQKAGLANYFAPPNVSPTTSGSGGILMGTTIDKAGSKASDARDNPIGAALDKSRSKPSDSRDPPTGSSARAGDREASRPAASGQANQSAAASIRQALQSMPDFGELSRNIAIEPTKDGVNVSLMDQEGRSMFPEGSVHPNERTRLVLEALAPTLRRLNNRLSVTGHTAAARPGSVRARRCLEPHRRARDRRARDPVGCRVPQRPLHVSGGTRRHRAGLPRQSLPRVEPTGDDHADQ